ncbi:DUF4082 domain-containing protein [Microbacterium protaetiae]|uniref:DUF4082 domain-containing protein n=1 Tax=Microbacterium protaetiae TaxID=2509458 RepID=UPI0024145AC4|nr:DUF4082 domain-containing protein [Microbacterium protaetiae]
MAPRTPVDPDRQSVELGVKFSVKKAGTITGIQFYRTPSNRGTHHATLWDAKGHALATVTFPSGSSTGWVTAHLSTPVAVKPGATYVASYISPRGGYSADENYFTHTVTRGNIVFPKGAGVYKYGNGGYPTKNFRNSNYYIDVVFAAESAPVTGSPSPTSSPTPSAPVTAPSPTPTQTQTPSPTPSQSAQTPPVTGTVAALDLPQEPWYGGSSYYAKFPKAAASGWTDSSFFPISVFLGKPEHASALKAAGINTYMGVEHDGSDISTVTRTGMSVIAQQQEWSTSEIGSDPGVVGWFLSDECEMGLGGCDSDTEQGRLAQQTSYAKKIRALNDGRFVQANFGNGVLGTYWAPNTMDDQLNLLDVSAVDKYAYTSPHVQDLIKYDPYWTTSKNPSSSAAYGWLQDRMETFSTTPKPNWVFVETGMPFLTEDGRTTITTGQIGGAVWSALIHGAAGVAYFQHNNNGSCGTYSIIQCGSDRLKAITAINAQVEEMAPALNSPTYTWKFGDGLDTALKVSNGSAYVVAMTTGGTGSRTFTLPPQLAKATSVEVVDEGRTVKVTNGTFQDDFAAEYTHHIYRVTVGG